ncbi:MAG TPA: bifunctional riboflavin kinase/FAD synthetase [Chthoniobacterales bacterium]|nr:bifunctional riboflavin kinase/FAD synthetase [Chthoniobacterales bacterium]
MKVLHSIEELQNIEGPTHLAIGVFDGVHLGHQAVIRQAVEAARKSGGRSVVLTFHPHPVRVLRPNDAPRLLTSTQHKQQLIERLGIDAFLIQEFSLAFSRTRPEEFIYRLVQSSNELKTICVGEGWSFGANRSGGVSLVRTLAESYHFHLQDIVPLAIDGQIVSSTRIREAVEQGDFALAERLLGRPFTILGTVVEGNHLGRKLGYPTANLRAHNEQFPPNGVYAVTALNRGNEYGGVANIGVRPTIQAQGGERLLEVYLFEFDREIYGDDVEVRFLKYLRPEQKFSSLADLQAQIVRDAESARAICQHPARFESKAEH